MSSLRSTSIRVPVAAAVIAMAAVGLVVLAAVAVHVGLMPFLGGLTLSLAPLPIYLGLALWIDRYEKEPGWTLVLSFLWGGTIAVFLSVTLGAVPSALLADLLGSRGVDLAAPLFVAPILEETAKGIALVALFIWRKSALDSVTDGIVYAAMVGLGFATTENVLYYGSALGTGIEESIAAFLLRGVLSPFSHPLFSAMVGLGLGLARERRGRLYGLAPATGFAAAILLHALWNFSALLGQAFFVTYFALMVPAFIGMIAVTLHSIGRERRVLRTYLAPYVADGTFSSEDLEALCSREGRRRMGRAAWAAGGLRGWRRHRQALHAAGELAFAQWRSGRDGVGHRSGDTAATLERFRRLRGPAAAGALALAFGAGAVGACRDAPPPGPAAGPAGPRLEAADTAPGSPRGTTDPVMVTGRVVTPETGKGIPGALFIVLRPGVEVAEWEASGGEESEELMEAAVRADSTGRYLVPALPRGHEYTVMIAARGYRSAVFDRGLTVEPDAPAVKEMDPVTLEPGVW